MLARHFEGKHQKILVIRITHKCLASGDKNKQSYSYLLYKTVFYNSSGCVLKGIWGGVGESYPTPLSILVLIHTRLKKWGIIFSSGVISWKVGGIFSKNS